MDSGNLSLGSHLGKGRRLQRIHLLIQHLTRVVIARNRAVDQRQKLCAQRSEDEILTISALFLGARLNKATLEQQRFVIG